MSSSTLAPTGLVYVCTVQVLLSSRCVGIAPPPISSYCTGAILVEACGHSSPLHLLVLYRCYSRRGVWASPPPPISLYCTGTILVEACGHSSPPPISLYCTGVIPVEEREHSPPPPHDLLGGQVAIGTVCFLCMWPVISRNLSLFYVWWRRRLLGCL